MILQKIKYKVSKAFSNIWRHSSSIHINWGYWLFSIICFVSIILLGGNVFRIIKKGYERYEIIQQERTRLEELYEKNYRLKDELRYYSSKEYIDIKAREELNLVFPDQKLVSIQDEEILIIDDEEFIYQEETKPNWRLWYDLLF